MSDVLRDVKIAIACNGSGAFTSSATTSPVIDGRWLESIEYVIGTIDTGATVTISVINRPSGVALTLLTLTSPSANAIYRVRVAEHGTTGSALSSTTRFILDGMLKVVVSSGGASGAGAIWFKYW